jgi:hypothetical protein
MAVRETIEQLEYQGRTFQVDGCWDKETPENTYDFFELWELPQEPRHAAICLTEGADPFYDRPSREELIEYIQEFDRDNNP